MRYRERVLEVLHGRIHHHHGIVHEARRRGFPEAMAEEVATARCRLAECLSVLEALEGPDATWAELEAGE